jgi:transposase-like protein
VLPKVNSLWEFLVVFPDEGTCLNYLRVLRWQNGISCPYCTHTHIYHLSDKVRYKCAKCRRQFRATTGTIFATRNIPLQKFFLLYYLLLCKGSGISAAKMARWLKITHKSAWLICHKVRLTLRSKSRVKKLFGVVEADETYVGMRRKRGAKRGRGGEHKTPVFGLIQRGGRVMTFPVADTKSRTLKPLIREFISKNSILMTDEYRSYWGVKKEYRHKTVNHKRREYARGKIHVNTLEGYWSLMKRGFLGTYHRPSRQHMDKYCAEFEFRYNLRGMNDNFRFMAAISRSRKPIKNRHVTE